MNCFIAFRLEKQKEIKAQFPGINHRSISKVVAKWWKELPEAEKQPYMERAKLAKKEHEQAYPYYRFCPQKRVGQKRKYTKNKQEDAELLSKVEMLSVSASPSVLPSPALSSSTVVTTPRVQVMVKKEEDEEDMKYRPELYTLPPQECLQQQQYRSVQTQLIYPFSEHHFIDAATLLPEQSYDTYPFSPALLDYALNSTLTLSHPHTSYIDPAFIFAPQASCLSNLTN